MRTPGWLTRRIIEKYVHKIKVMIGTALKQAVNTGMIYQNCADNVKLPSIDQKEMHVFSIEEQNALESICISSSDFSSFSIYLALNTGMRLGEILGLTWENVDLVKGNIHVL